jgi:hypothetical protein
MNLWNGLATLNIQIPEGAGVNDNIHFLTEVTDETQIDSFLNDFWIEVIDVKDRASRKPGGRKEKPGDNDGEDRQKETGLDIPTPIPVKKDQWNQQNGFDRESALCVIYGGEDSGYDFFLNMDNVYLKSELRNNNKIDVKMIEARYIYGMTLIGLSLLSYDKNKKNEDGPSIEDSVFSLTSAISPVLLPMISALGDLELE